MSMMKKRNIKGHDHLGPIVFKVLEEDAFGRPTKVEVGYDDTTFNLKGGEKFFTGYISVTAVDGALFPRTKA
jgi:hypothetical protein